jgi:hypothetical protein
MIPDHYVWLVWSSVFLIPWICAYVAFPHQRKAMVWASLFTLPLGLTEPLFVPAYWNPPSLFDFAQRTGFDIESLIFSFSIGGVGAVLYNLLTVSAPADLPLVERAAQRHRIHTWALAVPFVAFPLLYSFPWNPIYPAIIAMAFGALAAIVCRPDLAPKMGLGSILFLAYYALFLLGLEGTAPGYIERVWNLPALSGLEIAGLPIEELLFAAAFGAYWSSVYEHFTWRKLISAQWLGRRGTMENKEPTTLI